MFVLLHKSFAKRAANIEVWVCVICLYISLNKTFIENNCTNSIHKRLNDVTMF